MDGSLWQDFFSISTTYIHSQARPLYLVAQAVMIKLRLITVHLQARLMAMSKHYNLQASSLTIPLPLNEGLYREIRFEMRVFIG